MAAGLRTVYVIDDDRSVVRAFSRLIRAAGMKAVELSGVRELAKIEALDPDGTVVTDIRMPGESGLTVPATLAERGIPLPVIFVTATEDEKTRSHAEQIGAAFFTKPVDEDELLNAIRTAVRPDR